MPTPTALPKGSEDELVAMFDEAFLDLSRHYNQLHSEGRRHDEVEIFVELAAYRGVSLSELGELSGRTRQAVTKRVNPVLKARGLKYDRGSFNNPSSSGPYALWPTHAIVDAITEPEGDGKQAEVEKVEDMEIFRDRIVPAAFKLTIEWPWNWSGYRLDQRAQTLWPTPRLRGPLTNALREQRKLHGLPPHSRKRTPAPR